MATKEKKEFQKFDDITEAMKSEWRAKYGGKVEVISFPIDEDLIDGPEASFVVIPPSRRVIDAVAKYAEEKDFSRSNKVLITNCVLGGDMEYLEETGGEDKVYYGVLKALGETIKAAKKKVKKL